MFLLHRQRAGEGQPGEDAPQWALHRATIEFWRLRPARSSPGRPCYRVSVQGLRKWKCKLLSRVWLFWDPMDSNLGPWNSPGKDTGVQSHSLPSLGDLPDPGIKPGSPTVQADLSLSEPWRLLHWSLQNAALWEKNRLRATIRTYCVTQETLLSTL